MKNDFFNESKDRQSISIRLEQLEKGKVGFYSVGLYPASLAYNCAMQAKGQNLLLAPRKGRDLLGAFDSQSLVDMNPEYINIMKDMSLNQNEGINMVNTLADLIKKCELVILSSNSNYVENDLKEACQIRKDLHRENVVLACLVGSFCHDKLEDKSYVLCQKEHNLAFFSGFHRHGSLRNPSDSFTANFCHPDAITALFGSRLLDKISPNIQVSPGVHNVEAQYIKATKNISSIFAGFAHTFHKDNPGILPTLLTLLLDQCLNQAATVSMSRLDRKELYASKPFSITELGYGVQRIEAALLNKGNMQEVRDHTFSQLIAIVADVKGSMMQPQIGKPTRNFQVGSILANQMNTLKRCPQSLSELISWCESFGLKRGGLEGITSLKYWPDILRMYSIPLQDSSMINLLYVSIFGSLEAKQIAYKVLSNSRHLTTFCKESVKPKDSGKFSLLLSNFKTNENLGIISDLILGKPNIDFEKIKISPDIQELNSDKDHQYPYSIINLIEEIFSY